MLTFTGWRATLWINSAQVAQKGSEEWPGGDPMRGRNLYQDLSLGTNSGGAL